MPQPKMLEVVASELCLDAVVMSTVKEMFATMDNARWPVATITTVRSVRSVPRVFVWYLAPIIANA